MFNACPDKVHCTLNYWEFTCSHSHFSQSDTEQKYLMSLYWIEVQVRRKCISISISRPENHSCSLFLSASTAWRRGSELFQFRFPLSQTRRRTQGSSIILTSPTWVFRPHTHMLGRKHTYGGIQRNAIVCVSCIAYSAASVPILLPISLLSHSPAAAHIHTCSQRRQ